MKRFLELRTRLKDYPPEEMLDCFIAGLQGSIKTDVLKQRCKDLDQAIDVANWSHEILSSKANQQSKIENANYAKKQRNKNNGHKNKEKHNNQGEKNNSQHKNRYDKNKGRG